MESIQKECVDTSLSRLGEEVKKFRNNARGVTQG